MMFADSENFGILSMYLFVCHAHFRMRVANCNFMTVPPLVLLILGSSHCKDASLKVGINSHKRGDQVKGTSTCYRQKVVAFVCNPKTVIDLKCWVCVCLDGKWRSSRHKCLKVSCSYNSWRRIFDCFLGEEKKDLKKMAVALSCWVDWVTCESFKKEKKGGWELENREYSAVCVSIQGVVQKCQVLCK